MRIDSGELRRKMLIGLALMSAGARLGAAEGEKSADPFVKGNKPAVMASQVTGGANEGKQGVERLREIYIPTIEFREARIEDAIEFLRNVLLKNDPKKVGVNIVLNLQGAKPPAITFSARNISLFHAFKIITSVAGLKYEVEDNIVIISRNEPVSQDEAVAREKPVGIERLEKIIIPELALRQANIEDVVEFLRKVSVENDPQKVGVTIVLNLQGEKPPLITFSAKQISLFDAFRIITKVAGLKYQLDDNIVTISRE